MPNFISKVKLPNDTTYDIKSYETQGILYGTLDSTSTASVMVATVADLTASAYYDGMTVMLKNNVITAASSFTLNINGLGAKPVVTNSVSTNDNSQFIVNSTMLFTYSSSQGTNGSWICYHGVDNVDGIYYVAGSGSTASKTSSPYYAARWRGNNPSITTLYSGLCINYKLDVAGNGTYGTVLSINGGEEHPVCANVNSMISTRYAVGCIIPLVYDAAQTGSVYINSSSASTVTGCWKIADYDTNTVTQTVVRDFVVGKNAGILYRYQICMVDENDGLVPFNNVNNGPSNYTKATNTASFDPFRGLYWYGTTAAINPGAGASIGSNVMYLVYQQDARYSFNLNSGVASSQVAATQGATVYSTSYKYAVGSYCTYAGELYKCKTAITTAGAWDASKWTKITAYSSTSTYAVNDECIHSGYVWKCTTAIGSGGEAWNAAHWTYTTMTGMISSYPVYIKAKYNKTTHLATLVGDTTSTSYLVRSSITHGLPEENPNTGLAANEIYIYIFVGRSYTCYNLGMFATHPVYYWNDVAGKATIFSGAEEAVVPTKTSDLLNDGEDGVHPFISEEDIQNRLKYINLDISGGSWQTEGTYTGMYIASIPSERLTEVINAWSTDDFCIKTSLVTPSRVSGLASNTVSYTLFKSQSLTLGDIPMIVFTGDYPGSNQADILYTAPLRAILGISAYEIDTGYHTVVFTITSALSSDDYDYLNTTKVSYADVDSAYSSTGTNPVNGMAVAAALGTLPNVPTNTSDLINDGEDGTSTYVEARDLALVATSGSYNDLTDQPAIPVVPTYTDGSATIATVSSDVVTLKAGVTQNDVTISNSSGSDITLAKVAKTGSYNDLSNKPTIPSGTVTSVAIAAANGSGITVDSGSPITSSGTITLGTSGLEKTSNKVTSLSDSSTDTEYPSAKLLYTTTAPYISYEIAFSVIQFNNFASPLPTTVSDLYACEDFITAVKKPIYVEIVLTGFNCQGSLYIDKINGNDTSWRILLPQAITTQQGTFLGVQGTLAYVDGDGWVLTNPTFITPEPPDFSSLSYTASGLSASKTITSLSETDGIISATASNIAITSDQVTRNTTDATIATNDKLGIFDASDSNKLKSSSITFNTTKPGHFLTQSGTWAPLILKTSNYNLVVSSGTISGYETNGTGASTLFNDVASALSAGYFPIIWDYENYFKTGNRISKWSYLGTIAGGIAFEYIVETAIPINHYRRVLIITSDGVWKIAIDSSYVNSEISSDAIHTSRGGINIVVHSYIDLNTSAAAGSTSYTLKITYPGIGPTSDYIDYWKQILFYCEHAGGCQKPTSVTLDANGKVVLTFASTLNPESATSILIMANDDQGLAANVSLGSGVSNSAATGYNLAIGRYLDSEGYYSLLVGQQHANLNGAQSSVLGGSRNINTGSNSIVIGSYNKNTKGRSALFGYCHDNTNGPNNMGAIGEYSIISSDSKFVVGNGTATSARSNAFEVHTDGRATVGADPTNNMDVATKQYADTIQSNVTNVASGASAHYKLSTMTIANNANSQAITINDIVGGFDCAVNDVVIGQNGNYGHITSWSTSANPHGGTVVYDGTLVSGYYPITGGEITGDVTLYKEGANPGDSYALIFQRGTLTDAYNDWRIQDRGGYLQFDQRGSGSTAWSNVAQMTTDTLTISKVSASTSVTAPTVTGSTLVTGPEIKATTKFSFGTNAYMQYDSTEEAIKFTFA